MRILLAEDNETNQQLAVRILGKRGHVVVLANDGREALALIEAEPDAFDLVLMDVQMPHMDGLAATQAIRALESGTGRRVPIVAMTAHGMDADRNRCRAAGMDGYVSKPFDIEELLATIDAHASPGDADS
jgi:CheY-like chemotaxis protein